MSPESNALDGRVLTLGIGPRGVQEARHWVIGACAEIGRADLTATAELGVSELVTNALLHAEPPFQVAVRGTRDHPRIEVADGSVEPPELPDPDDSDDLDALLSTFGRGLGLVARASLAWGVELEDDGKVVWFVPASELGDEMSDGVVTGQTPPPTPAPDDTIEFTLESVPVADVLAFERHYRELRRELRLLALAHEDDYPLAKTLADLFGALESTLRRESRAGQVETAHARGVDVIDLEVEIPDGGIPELERLIDLLDLADVFCREARLLALARSDEQRAFQTWLLREVIRRASGEPGTQWRPPAEPGRGVG